MITVLALEPFRYLMWLPRWLTKAKPCARTMATTSAELSNLATHHALADQNLIYLLIICARSVLEVKCDSLLQV
jgi:hypothetical protein